ncbi:MAG: DUF4097 family beta strand repeat protein [Chthoniobacterales bacterium]|nr:DUF4097 family beta strand repeat protein [Chthoniobacterales bacterium]
MKTPISLTILLASAFSALAAEQTIHETRVAQSGGKLVVDVDFGSITVSPGENDKVVVDAYRKVETASEEKEQRYFAAVPVRVTTEGDTVYVRATRSHESFFSQMRDLLGSHRTEGRYTIRVPANFRTDLDTSGGHISVTGLTGASKADTSGGDITFAQVRGDIHADTSGGEIKISNGDGKIHLDTSGGRIEVTNSRGQLGADTSGGPITVMNFTGDTKVESSGGKLRLDNISGKLNAETSGGAIAAILSAPVVGDVRLETSAGAITVLAPRNAGLDVDAETGAGSVHSELPMTGTQSDHDSLKGAINGGGRKLVLRSGAGAIEIVSAEKQTAQQ